VACFLDAVSLCRWLSSSKSLWRLRYTPRFAKRIDPYISYLSQIFTGNVNNQNEETQSDEYDFNAPDEGEPESNLDHLMSISINHGNYPQLYASFEAGASNWDVGMVSAIKTKDQFLVNLFLRKGAHNWNLGLRAAAAVGDKALVEYFVQKGAQNLELSLCQAITNNHTDVALLLIEKATQKTEYFGFEAMEKAIFKGRKDLIDLMVQKQDVFDWNDALWCATLTEQKDLVEFFAAKDINQNGLRKAIKSCKNEDIKNYLSSCTTSRGGRIMQRGGPSEEELTSIIQELKELKNKPAN